jgi:hypothetical protein
LNDGKLKNIKVDVNVFQQFIHPEAEITEEKVEFISFTAIDQLLSYPKFQDFFDAAFKFVRKGKEFSFEYNDKEVFVNLLKKGVVQISFTKPE